MDPRAGLDDSKKKKFLTLPGLVLRPLCRTVRSQSLYRLRYPSVCTFCNSCVKTDFKLMEHSADKYRQLHCLMRYKSEIITILFCYFHMHVTKYGQYV
jgi:hypothetical protein